MFKALGAHWQHNPRHAPEPTRRQREILTGLLFGGGAYTGPLSTPSVQATVKNERLAEWLETELDSLKVNVRVDGETYYISTPSNPALKPYFQNWYSKQEEPRPPNTSELTPLVAKVWFAVNGHAKNGAIHLRASYAVRNLGWHRELFREVGFNPWRENPTLVFPVEQAKELLDYMGEPLPGTTEEWEQVRSNSSMNV
ncbi:hypothetical protein [Halorussus salinisoli]|uniref:hypothetical protein n=1 Tax=Halorussus salinisoli TaxID=2558242 RepID=UPI0010C21677|nr:hypothetical protein [Halorussus salinisoli]